MEKEGDERKSDPKRRRIDGKIHVRPSVRTAPLFYTVAESVVGREWREGDRESDGVVNKRYDFRRQIWERAGAGTGGASGGTAGGWLL